MYYLEVSGDLVYLLQIVQYLSWRGAYLLGKVSPQLEAELWVCDEEVSIQDVALSSVQVLVSGVEHPESLWVETSRVRESSVELSL